MPDLLVVISDQRDRWAAGAVTDADGWYRVESLRPGRYTVNNLSAFSSFVPAARPVRLTLDRTARADLELRSGQQVSFRPVDIGGDGLVDAELRDGAGRVRKAWAGAVPADGEAVAFGGLEAGAYTLVLRRYVPPGTDPTVLPWTMRRVVIVDHPVNLGDVALDRPTLDLRGRLPRDAQVKITPVPSDVVLRREYLEGASVTGMALNWTEPAEDGQYLSRGLVPGDYIALVTAQYDSPVDAPGARHRGNVAATLHRFRLTPTTTTRDFSAPTGGVVKGRMRYAGTTRPLIAPVGYEVLDPGDHSWLFPTVSNPQQFADGFRVERLHAGRGTGQLLDQQALADFADATGTLVPDTLLRSAPISERGTPYWLEVVPRPVTVRCGAASDLGWVDVWLRS